MRGEAEESRGACALQEVLLGPSGPRLGLPPAHGQDSDEKRRGDGEGLVQSAGACGWIRVGGVRDSALRTESGAWNRRVREPALEGP